MGFWDRVLRYSPRIAFLLEIVSAISALVAVAGWVANKWVSHSGPVLAFLSSHSIALWLAAVSAFAFALGLWNWHLYRRFIRGFHDNFRRPLNLNWDYVGEWRLAEHGVLEVTNSDPGGITKLGTFWED